MANSLGQEMANSLGQEMSDFVCSVCKGTIEEDERFYRVKATESRRIGNKALPGRTMPAGGAYFICLKCIKRFGPTVLGDRDDQGDG